jgi:hypothetical protein
MFALPGTLALVFLIYVRPQEVFPWMEALPLLYLCFALALFGLVVDVRLRVTRTEMAPQLPWALALGLWCVVATAVNAPDRLISTAMAMAIMLTLFSVIAQGVQLFRAFHVVAALLLGLAGFLAIVGVEQGRSDFGCVMIDEDDGDLTTGSYDGRACEVASDCLQDDPEPGRRYMCERIGLLDTTSIGGGRVRYRGVLQDPNELSLAVSVGMALAFAFFGVKPSVTRAALAAAVVLVATWCLYYSQSRGGQLVYLAVLGVYAVQKWRWKAVIGGGAAALLVLLLLSPGGERSDAAASAEERLNAWAVGLELLRVNPFFGVGHAQFVEHYYLTAHNSYVLAPAELGLPGMLLWMIVVYLSAKIPLVALARYREGPGATLVRPWATAVLASLAGVYVGAFFLSFCYHFVLWIHLGLAGALYGAIRRHDRDFRVRFGVFDLLAVIGACAGLLMGLWFYLRLKGI